MFQNTITRSSEIVPKAGRLQNEGNSAQLNPDGMITKAAAMVALMLSICLIRIIDAAGAGSDKTIGTGLVD